MAVTTHKTMAVTVHSGFGAQENKGFLGRSVAKNLPTMQETDLIPGLGTKTPHAVACSQEKKKKISVLQS